MKLLPVLDVRAGQVMAGIGGRREEYRPIRSRLTDSADPLAVARAIRAELGLDELYVADLDALAGQRPNISLYAALGADGFRLWVDPGLRQADDAGALDGVGLGNIVAALESLAGPRVLGQLCQRFARNRVVFSLDLRAGEPLGSSLLWGSADPWVIAQRAIVLGVRRFIVLDLADVGMNRGSSTEALCQRLRLEYPHLELTTGGGVRGPADLRSLSKAGIDCVLVASALHEGRLTRADLLSGQPGA